MSRRLPYWTWDYGYNGKVIVFLNNITGRTFTRNRKDYAEGDAATLVDHLNSRS